MSNAVAETAAARIRGERASRTRALVAAAVVAVGAGVATYKVLRA